MSFNAHDLKVAFEDGIKAERTRLLELLRNKIMYEGHTDNAILEYNYYVKLFNSDDHWDIGEL